MFGTYHLEKYLFKCKNENNVLFFYFLEENIQSILYNIMSICESREKKHELQYNL